MKIPKTYTRADKNNNPTCFTTALAEQADLKLGLEYEAGDIFPTGVFFTAKIIGDPVKVTIKLIDKLGFYTKAGTLRWSYIGIPYKIWIFLTPLQKTYVIGEMYKIEGGTTMTNLFPENP